MVLDGPRRRIRLKVDEMQALEQVEQRVFEFHENKRPAKDTSNLKVTLCNDAL